MAKTSALSVVKDAKREERAALYSVVGSDATRPIEDIGSVRTLDSFINFAQKMGIGADNPLSSATYGFNPITRMRILLEWIHRGSWLGGVAVDVVAEDMTRMGIDYKTELPPEDSEKLDTEAAALSIWPTINECIKWGRLYGGSLGVMLIDGQDMRTPFKLETVGKNQFKGLLVLDRWMVEPVLNDLVTDFGPHLGLPKYYRVQANAPALRGVTVHYTRCAFRMDGVKLPYNQRLTENLWGISVLERLYDRMIAYDSASTGAAQLVYKSYLRTLTIDGMREVVAAGGPALDGLIKYTEMMRRFQGIEGITLIDGKDKFEAQVHGAFSGLDDVLMNFAQQLSGALQIPLTRLFGQAPAGLNATGDNDMRNYYDMIKQRQESSLGVGVLTLYQCMAQSIGVNLPKQFAIAFKSLWQLTETDKSTIAKTDTETTLSAQEAGVISPQTVLRELRQSSRITGRWTNITTELIDAADEELPPPPGEGMFTDPSTGEPLPVAGADPSAKPPGGEKPVGKQDGKQTAQARPAKAKGQVVTSATSGGKVSGKAKPAR